MKLRQVIYILAITGSVQTFAEDFLALDEALPLYVDAASIAPVFDFDGDGCLPAAGISRSGEQNGGLKPGGTLGGKCRDSRFLDTSNTLHRHACKQHNGDLYCGHFYSLYFEKDQVINYWGGGHRHDWEHAAVFTKNGEVTHGSYSAHGDTFTKAAADLPFEGNHLKIVYHKDGVLTHAMRFAKLPVEVAENPYGSFVTPTIVSWQSVVGDNIDNAGLRLRLNQYNYGSASIPVKDSNFLSNLNEARPASYPQFVQSDIDSQ